MKYLLIAFFTLLLLSGGAINATAGFVVKDHPANTVLLGSKTVSGPVAAIEKQSNSFPFQQPYGHGRREAGIAFWFAMWGLLFPPLGILAIIHGARSLRRGKADRGLAITSIIFGGVEVLLTILYIFLFVAFVIVL